MGISLSLPDELREERRPQRLATDVTQGPDSSETFGRDSVWIPFIGCRRFAVANLVSQAIPGVSRETPCPLRSRRTATTSPWRSLGETPGILPACPSDRGRTAVNFCRASVDRASSAAYSSPSGNSNSSIPAMRTAAFRSRARYPEYFSSISAHSSASGDSSIPPALNKH